MMFEFQPVIAHVLDECLEALSRYGTDAALLAGGTDLYILMKTGMKAPKVVLAIGGIPELGAVEADDGAVTLGAGITHSELVRLKEIAGVDCLSKAAGAIGSPQIRNVGTAGGNIANASPAGDLYPPFMVLDAVLELRNSKGTREITVEDFIKGPGMTAIKPDEMISRIRLTKPRDRFFSDFVKVGLRNALAVSVACTAVLATWKDGRFGEVRIACGAVAPRPMRMRQVEHLLAGQEPTRALISEAAEVAARECDPLTDIRATQRYRRHVTGVIVSRLVEAAWSRLAGDGGKRKPDA